jgi:hypothetical protein
VVTPASAPLSPPEALSPAVSMRLRLCWRLWPTETSSALIWLPPSTASRIACLCASAMIQGALDGCASRRRTGHAAASGIRLIADQQSAGSDGDN